MAGDHATALRVAHTLKGTAATLAADKLSEMARHLEATLRGGGANADRDAELGPQMEAIRIEFQAMSAALPATSMVASTDVATLDPAKCKRLLDQLEALLAQCDTTALSLLEENAASLRSALGGRFDAFAREIGQFGFDRARRILQDLRQESGG